MKAQLRHIINALRITEQLHPCESKDREIDYYCVEVSKLGINIDSRVSGDINYREFGISDSKEGFEVSVIIIQTSDYDMIIIDADFGEE